MSSTNEEQGFNRKPWFVLTFLLGFAEGLIGTFFPLVFLHFGGSNFELGLFVGIISLLGSFQIFWGKIIDKFEVPKKLSIASLSVNTATALSMASTSSSSVFGISRAVNGLSNSGFANSDYFLRTAYFPVKNRGKTQNYFMAINLFGVSTSITIVGVVYDRFGFDYSHLIHYIAAGIFVVAFFMYLRYVPEFNPKYVRDEQILYARVKDRANLDYSVKEIIQLMKLSPGLIKYLFGMLVFNIGFALSGPFFIVELNREWGFKNSELALMLSFNSISQVLVILVLLPFIDFVDRKKLIIIGLLLACVPVFALSMKPEWIETYFSSTFLFWMGIFFIASIGWGILNSTTLTLLVDYVNPKIRSTIIAGYGSATAFLAFFAAVLGGILIDFVLPNNQFLFLISTIIRFLGFIIIFKTTSPPIPFADFYAQRQLFMARFRSNFEKSIQWLPISRRFKSRNKKH
ncbi:MAG: hypothetical protein HeimC2_33520 [Candidatus Heimdallarchaeota archaeon LC_2]|nr:MAG: hypothetical protein HeimC2_33520 [Candidatus Heimdallarchaeota archaeon LC_2]